MNLAKNWDDDCFKTLNPLKLETRSQTFGFTDAGKMVPVESHDEFSRPLVEKKSFVTTGIVAAALQNSRFSRSYDTSVCQRINAVLASSTARAALTCAEEKLRDLSRQEGVHSTDVTDIR